jgi:hypothetical protein
LCSNNSNSSNASGNTAALQVGILPPHLLPQLPLLRFGLRGHPQALVHLPQGGRQLPLHVDNPRRARLLTLQLRRLLQLQLRQLLLLLRGLLLRGRQLLRRFGKAALQLAAAAPQPPRLLL